MAGATGRFTTTELGELEQKIAQASGHGLQQELDHFAGFSTDLLATEPLIRAAAEALALLDALSGLAELAVREGHARPVSKS